MFKKNYLIINADDLGYCPERNKGIIEAFNNHSISSASILINGLFAEEAVKLALENNLPLGLHFNITEGKPICDSTKVTSLVNQSSLFLGKFALREALDNNSVNIDHIRLELEAQIEKFISLNGKVPTHVDGHQHIHVYKSVNEVFARTLKKYNIEFTRIPYEELNDSISDERLRFYKSVLTDSNQSIKIFENCNLKYPRGFVGLTTMGSMMSYKSLTIAFEKSFSNVNIVELMVHPGYPSVDNIGGCDTLNGPDEFSKSHERLQELKELSNKNLKEFYKEKNIDLISFEDLSTRNLIG